MQAMFQSYIKVFLSYLKLSYFILNLCIVEQLLTPHASVVYFISLWIRQLMDGEYGTLQGKVGQGWLYKVL